MTFSVDGWLPTISFGPYWNVDAYVLYARVAGSGNIVGKLPVMAPELMPVGRAAGWCGLEFARQWAQWLPPRLRGEARERLARLGGAPACSARARPRVG